MGSSLEPSDPIFRLPRPWWHYIVPSLFGVFWFSIAAMAEWSLLQPGPVTFKDRGGVDRTMTRADRWPNMALWGVLLVVAPLLPLSYALTSPMVIRKHGLEIGLRNRQPGPVIWALDWALAWMYSMLHRLFLRKRWELTITPWEQIGDCHWNRFQRGALIISGPSGLLYFSIPERHRAEVEAAFRRFGKWRD